MDNNEKQNLDNYRQERKERIAKQNKAAAKKSNSHEGAKSVMGRIVGGVIAVALVVAILFGSLNFFGVPQRVVKAVTIDGESYSMSELSLYYMQIYTNYANYSYSYDQQYGEGYGAMLTGYDYSISPAKQSTKDADGNEITWDEFFMDEAIKNMANIKRYLKAAEEAGITLDETAQAEIQESIDSIQAQIDSYKTTNPQIANYSVSGFLTIQYGKGVTESFFRKVLEEQKMVELYQQSRQDALGDAHTMEEIEAVYAAAPSDYDVVDFRWYTIDVNPDTADGSSTEAELSSEEADAALAAATQKAEAFVEKVKSEANYNEETFKKVVLDTVGKDDKNYETYKQEAATLLQKATKATVKSNVSEDAAKWFFETNDDGAYVRQSGDMTYFTSSDNETVYIFYATGTPYRDETKRVSVRHILVKFPEATTEAASEEALTGEDETAVETATVAVDKKDECKKEAESILADYKAYITENLNGEADAEYFAELASSLSDDTASAAEGGLIADLANDGQYVPAFEDWAFSEGEFAGQPRDIGTTGIIESEYGYHVMFYDSVEENADWYQSIINSKVSEDWEAEQTKFEEGFAEDAIARKDKVVAWVKDACLDIIGG